MKKWLVRRCFGIKSGFWGGREECGSVGFGILNAFGALGIVPEIFNLWLSVIV